MSGIRGAPLSYRLLSMPCYFYAHLGFEVVPGWRCPLASELQSWTAFRGIFCSRAPTSDRFRAPARDCIRAPTPDYVQAPVPDYVRGVIDHLGLKKFKGSYPSLMPEMPSIEPATCIRALCWTASEVMHHLGLGLIVYEFYFRCV